MGEIVGDVVPGLEGIGTKLDEGAHRLSFLRVDKIVAVEKLFLVGEDRMAIGGNRDIFVKPGVDFGIVLRLGRGWRHEEELIGLEQRADGLLG